MTTQSECWETMTTQGDGWEIVTIHKVRVERL